MSLEQKDGERVAVALFPVDYATVGMISGEGEEILEQDFSEEQLFMHSIQELERVRMERKMTTKRKIHDVAGGVSENGEGKKLKISNGNPADDDDIAMIKEQAATEETPTISEDVKEEPKVLENGSAAVKENGTSDHIDTDVLDLATEQTTENTEKESDAEDGVEEKEEEVIDPRIHYRPMVAELQASIIELNQLINTIDLIRRREYLEDMQCIRENTAEKKEELEHLIESKAQQLKESSRILLAGVDALTATVEKESNFFEGVSETIRKWKICAPIHGNIPKPFRAGEPLAVDCSFVSGGSTFTPPTRSIADLAFAELSRTEKGLVCIKTPEEYMARTIQVELRSLASGAAGSYRLPALKMSSMTRAMLDRLENNPDDLKILDERNTSVLKAVQFSVFCEELFYTVMQEALWNSASWSDSALSTRKPSGKKSQRGNDDNGAHGPTNVTVVEILDDEIQLRLRDQYEMTIRLIDTRTADFQTNASRPTANGTSGRKASNGHREFGARSSHQPYSEDEYLGETCRLALLLLQQEIRQRHGRNELSRGMLFTSGDGTSSTGAPLGGVQQTAQVADADKSDSNGVLAAVVSTISHNLLKDEVARYLDDVSAKLAWQNMHSSSTGRILEDGLNQPICDSVRGIYVSPRWKTCPYDSTLAAFDLNIGKNFSTEVIISGTKVRFEDGPGMIRETSSLAGLQRFVEKTICSQVAQSLHRDFASFGLKQSTVDLDRSSVRLFVAGEWDGSCIGDGRVPDTKPTSCILFEPYFTTSGAVTIKCVLQAVDTTKLEDLGESRKNGKGERLYDIEWERIPGNSDVAKTVWLLQKTSGLPTYFATPLAAASASALALETTSAAVANAN